MANIKELVAAVQGIKETSDDLTKMVAAAGNTLSAQAKQIAALTQPSRSGKDAAVAVGAASQSVLKAAAIMKSLIRACDTYLSSVVK